MNEPAEIAVRRTLHPPSALTKVIGAVLGYLAALSLMDIGPFAATLPVGLAASVGLAVWGVLLLVRSGASFRAPAVLAIVAASLALVSFVTTRLGALVALVLVTIAVIQVAARGEGRQVRDQERRAREHAAKVARVKEWEAAYAEVHGGQAPPSGAVPLDALTAAPDSTNSYAIVSLVLGVLGGLLAIPFGHIALSQIKRTGERGRGMALAGTILGYVWLAGLISVVIAVLVLQS